MSRAGACEINELVMQVKFPRKAALATLPGDMESNPANYERGKLKTDVKTLKPYPLKVHKGMQVYLTRNVRKETDFVNGMLARIEKYDPATKGLTVSPRQTSASSYGRGRTRTSATAHTTLCDLATPAPS